MPCKAEYPDKPCPFGFEGRLTRENCGACKNYVPPRFILSGCSLYDREGKVCLKSQSSCRNCPEHNPRRPGRPRSETVDWTDPESVRKYQADWREENREKIQKRFEEWKEKNPDYFKRYQQNRRKRVGDAKQG